MVVRVSVKVQIGSACIDSGLFDPTRKSGSGHIVLGALVAAGSSDIVGNTSGSAAIVLGALAVAGSGDLAGDLSGSAAITLGALIAAGSSDIVGNTSGSAAIVLGALVAAGSGDLAGDLSGSAAITLGALIAAGSSDIVGNTDGSAAITLGALVAAGSAALVGNTDGSAAITLGALVAIGSGDLSGSIGGLNPTTIAVTATVRYHPHSQAATLDGSNRVLSCPDLQGLADLTGVSFGGATVGPVQKTDANGLDYWEFTPAQYLLIANALAGLNHRQLAVFAVWRAHKVTRGEQVQLFSTRYSAYTNDTTNTNRSNGYTCAWNSAAGAGQSTVGRLFNGTVDAFTDATNGGKMVPPANMHVVGSVSRTTANGGTRFYINSDHADVAQSNLTGTADVGGIIGGKGAASNGVTASSTCFDLYEYIVIKGTLTNAQSDAIVAAMMANWNIDDFDSQLILLGESTTECIDTATTVVTPADNIAMTLTAPGAELIPKNVKVINAAVGGSGIATAYTGVSLVSQRDNASGPLIYTYPGGPSKNIITCNIGINDMRVSNGNLAAATHYSNFVALLNTASVGYLQRGFSVVAVTPTAISGDATGQSRIVSYRGLLVDPSTDVPVSQFLTDVQANAGQAYDGLVTVLPLCKIQYAASGTIFLDATDAADTTYYAGDGSHHQKLGYQLQATGGSTPQYGYGSIL